MSYYQMLVYTLIHVLCLKPGFVFSGYGAHPYLSATMARATTPYRPKTCKTYRRQFQLLLAFSLRAGAKTVLSVSTLISFLEFLIIISCNTSVCVVNNYVCGIKGYATWMLAWKALRTRLQELCCNPPSHKRRLTISVNENYKSRIERFLKLRYYQLN